LKIVFVISLMMIAAGVVTWMQDINGFVTILLLIVGAFGALTALFSRFGGSETFVDSSGGE
jgi:hypothetical protein